MDTLAQNFTNFLVAISTHNPDKLNTLINYVDPTVYDYIAECTTYEEAIDVHKALYVKPKNEIFARHLLATRKQQSGETLDEFMQALKQLAKDCNFRNVTANEYKEEAIRDAFINGLQSNLIRQRLLENKVLELQSAYDQARALDVAQRVLPHMAI